jgi:hypothetical protein
VAAQRRRDMIADAEAHRIARAARASRPALPPRPMRIILRLIAAARRLVTRLLPVKAAVEAGSK